MIAYDHCIEFVSISEKKRTHKKQNLKTITIKESFSPGLQDKCNYTLHFFNNQGREIMLHSDMDMTPTQEGRFWAFEIKDVVIFYWLSGAKTISYMRQEYFSEALLKYWSLHIVLPVYFTVEEIYDFLHAGAVEVNGKPVLFTADSFGGKSTMTDFFMKKGHTMISDDKVAIFEQNNIFFATPSHPHHRPYRKMEDLGFDVKSFASSPKPMEIVYVLEKVDPDAPIEIMPIQGMEKLITLRRNSEMNLFFLKPKRLEFLGRLSRKIQLFKVKVPWELERLDEIYWEIIEHTKSVWTEKH